MKKLLISLSIIICVFVSNAQKQTNSPMIDTIMYISDEGNDFKGFLNGNIITERAYNYNLSPIIGADQFSCLDHKEGRGMIFFIEYSNKNRVRSKVKKELTTFLLNLVQEDHRFSLKKENSSGTLLINKNGNEFIRLDEYSDSRFEIAIYPSITIKIADEAPYKGKFPSAPIVSNEPQIWEIRGKGLTPNSYLRINGISKNGTIQRGTKTFSGYGDFYDGVWESNDWEHPDVNQSFKVSFKPKNSNDTIYGEFQLSDMTLFTANLQKYFTWSKYEQKYKVNSDAPKWILKTYLPYDVERREKSRLLWEKYVKEHPEAANFTISDEQKAFNAKQNADRAAWNFCVCCHGTGTNDVYDKDKTFQNYDRYGNKQGDPTHVTQKTCVCCHGSGR